MRTLTMESTVKSLLASSKGIPWRVSFSFGRALQSPALKIWKGSPANVEAAQAALHHRAKGNGFALQGKYSTQMENTKT